MKHIPKIAGYNLLVLLGYSLFIRLVSMGEGSGSDRGLSIMVLSAFAVGIHVVGCFGVAVWQFIRDRKSQGNAWLLTAGIVLVIGFSTCLGNAALK